MRKRTILLQHEFRVLFLGEYMPGLAIFIVAIFTAAITGMFTRVKNQKTTTGTVVSVEYKYDSGETKPTFYAYAEYEVDGTVYTVKSRNRSSSYHTGQKLKIAYNGKNPSDSFIKPTSANYLVVVIIFVIAVIVTILTI